MYEKAIKKGPTANLQRLQQHNRQQPLPASHTSLAWGVTGASLYQSHTAMFTIAPTMLCQLPQCTWKWMPMFGENIGMKVAVYKTCRRTRWWERKAAKEIKVTSQKRSPLMKRFRNKRLLWIQIEVWSVGSQVSVKAGTSELLYNLRCTSQSTY